MYQKNYESSNFINNYKDWKDLKESSWDYDFDIFSH